MIEAVTPRSLNIYFKHGVRGRAEETPCVMGTKVRLALNKFRAESLVSFQRFS